MIANEIVAYLVSPGIKAPPGAMETKIPGHYIIVAGEGPQSAPILIKEDLLASVPTIMDELPFKVERADNLNDDIAVFYMVVPEPEALVKPVTVKEFDATMKKVEEKIR